MFTCLSGRLCPMKVIILKKYNIMLNALFEALKSLDLCRDENNAY